jgi:hypothetical protein
MGQPRKEEAMKVLVACEYSGAVRDAFLALGHDATSCDLLPTDVPGPHHQGDVFDIIDDGWDLMIAHPPCTYLCNSGVRWLTDGYRDGDVDKMRKALDRWPDMVDGAVFFRRLLSADIPRIAVENPVMHGHARKIIGRGPDQVVQPWMFGHPEKKGTGLWLKGLPPLLATDDVRDAMATLPKSETDRIHMASPGPDRWKLRSTTYAGIAAAMAEQWGDNVREVAA